MNILVLIFASVPLDITKVGIVFEFPCCQYCNMTWKLEERELASTNFLEKRSFQKNLTNFLERSCQFSCRLFFAETKVKTLLSLRYFFAHLKSILIYCTTSYSLRLRNNQTTAKQSIPIIVYFFIPLCCLFVVLSFCTHDDSAV